MFGRWFSLSVSRPPAWRVRRRFCKLVNGAVVRCLVLTVCVDESHNDTALLRKSRELLPEHLLHVTSFGSGASLERANKALRIRRDEYRPSVRGTVHVLKEKS
jgi:hypothetical protein